MDYVVSPGEDRYRRGVYVVWKRAAPYPSFVNFDATARLACTREALALEYAAAGADAAERPGLRRSGQDTGPAHPHRTRRDERRPAAGICIPVVRGRTPRPEELTRLRQLLTAERAAVKLDPQDARELAAGFDLPTRIAALEFAAWYAVAQTLLNLDETMTKG